MMDADDDDDDTAVVDDGVYMLTLWEAEMSTPTGSKRTLLCATTKLEEWPTLALAAAAVAMALRCSVYTCGGSEWKGTHGQASAAAAVTVAAVVVVLLLAKPLAVVFVVVYALSVTFSMRIGAV
jgi:hypothetical protein